MNRIKRDPNEGDIEISIIENDYVQICLNEDGCNFLLEEFNYLRANNKYVIEYPSDVGYDCGILTKASRGLFIAWKGSSDCYLNYENNQDNRTIEIHVLRDSSIQIVVDALGCSFLINELETLLKDKTHIVRYSKHIELGRNTDVSLGLTIVCRSL